MVHETVVVIAMDRIYLSTFDGHIYRMFSLIATIVVVGRNDTFTGTDATINEAITDSAAAKSSERKMREGIQSALHMDTPVNTYTIWISPPSQ